MASGKEWMLGLPGHNELVTLEEVARLISGGQLRETDLIKRVGSPWRAANEVPELMGYFGAPPLRVREREEPERKPAPEPAAQPSKAATTRHPKAEPSGRATARITRHDGPASTRHAPLRKTHPPASASRPPAEKPAESKPAESSPPEPAPPPPVRLSPRLEPMTPKYFSPVDLLRAASHAFEPKKLLLAAAMLVPLLVFWSLIMFFHQGAGSAPIRMLLFVLASAAFVVGASLICVVLSYVTRRQLEGEELTLADAVVYGTSNLLTAVAYPALVLVPSLFALVCLWLLGFVRDAGPGAAAALKIAYLLPMLFALAAVVGLFLFQLASMYIPAAAAIEGQGLTGAVSAVWANTRHQRGRVVLHWLIVTVAVGVITAVCMGLARLSLELPNLVFSRPTGGVEEAWSRFRGLFATYEGLAYGLGLTLPLSLFSTLGVLSYMALRHPVSAPLGAWQMDETGHGELESSPGPLAAMEATHPAVETKSEGTSTTPPPPPLSDPPKNDPGAETK